MGQYFEFYNIDKHEVLSCNSGLKEMEHSYLGNTYVESALQLFANRWKGDRVVHLGDYYDELANNPRFAKLVSEVQKNYESKGQPLQLNDYIKNTQFTPIRYVLVEGNKYIDRYNIGFGENERYTTDDSVWKGKDRDGNAYFVANRVDNFTLAIALGEGSGGSYHFLENSKQEQLHGSIAGLRIEGISNTLPEGREEIILKDFANNVSLKDVCSQIENEEQRLIFINDNPLSDSEKEFVKNYKIEKKKVKDIELER